jgi:hypothetical protein
MSPEIRLLVAPDATYEALARTPGEIGAIRALRRPFLVLVVIGVSMALSATRHVTLSLVVSTTVIWSVVVLAQAAIALAVIPRVSKVSRARAFDLFFASHVPWSLWLLFDAAWAPAMLGRPAMPLWFAAVPPLVLTPRMIAAFFRQVCGMDRRRAAIRTLLQQALSWALLIALYGAAVAIWPRVLQVLR